MSNSAFTPTTTTVTNNVPTNVPVVTAWENYTPTFNGFGTVTGLDARWMRVGTSLRAQIKFTSGTVPVATVGRISIPSGLTIDSSAQNKILGTAATQRTTTSGTPNIALIFVETGQTVNIAFTNVADGTIKNLSAIDSTALFGNNAAQSVEFEVPIAEWAGSGTTTLATRAVEEYAYNTSTTDADDTTSFGYGPAGVNFGSFTAARSKRVRFQTAIQSTDRLSLEFKRDGQWIPIEACTTQGAAPFFIQGPNTYGMTLEQIAGNNTDITVKFGIYRNTSNATYGGAGNAWSFLAGGNAQWRVRKVSSGAQVGYPVSARNIVGDTSGTAVPTGMIGEVVTQSITRSAQTSFTSGVARNITTNPLQLSAGVWEISANFIAESGSGDTISQASIGIGTTPATLPAGDIIGVPDSGGQIRVIWTGSVTNNMTNVCISPYRVIVSSSLTLYAVGIATHAGGAANIFGSFRAVRIA